MIQKVDSTVIGVGVAFDLLVHGGINPFGLNRLV